MQQSQFVLVVYATGPDFVGHLVSYEQACGGACDCEIFSSLGEKYVIHVLTISILLMFSIFVNTLLVSMAM